MAKKTKKPVKRIYGWKPDLPDIRDHMYGDVQPTKPIALPPSVNLSPNCSPVEDQGSLGSCTANALVGALEYIEQKDKCVFVDLSRLFVYYNERKLEGTVNQDSGAQIRDGIKTLASQGICSEKNWPYMVSKFTNKPTTACYKEGLLHTITSYQRINNLNDMKTCLASGYPFVFGFTVYESFESQEVATTGILPMPSSSERVVGGHAVCCVGYDDSKKMVLVRNSWGVDWGLKGYFWMPYNYISNNNLATDMWKINIIKGF